VTEVEVLSLPGVVLRRCFHSNQVASTHYQEDTIPKHGRLVGWDDTPLVAHTWMVDLAVHVVLAVVARVQSQVASTEALKSQGPVLMVHHLQVSKLGP